MIVLVCGSRDWGDAIPIVAALEFYATACAPLVVIEGGAGGADRIAGTWAANARRRGVGWVRFPADWDGHGKAAGPIRNQQMLDWMLLSSEPKLVLAFKDAFDRMLQQGGTEDMVRRSTAAGVPTYVFDHRTGWQKAEWREA